MSISSLLTRSCVTASPEDQLVDVARSMEKENVGAVVVTKQQRPVGIITDRDLALAVCSQGLSPHERVSNIMTCPVETLSWNDDILSATRKMMELGVRRLPIVSRDAELIGLVSLDDLLMLFSRELNNMAEGIRAEVDG